MQPAILINEEFSDEKMMDWDLPNRVFRLKFAFSCTGSLSIALFVDDKSALFLWHMLLGMAACLLFLA